VWCSQGIEVDYVAEAASLEEVTQLFEVGLAATIEETRERFGAAAMLRGLR
jgi:hypothetical protein